MPFNLSGMVEIKGRNGVDTIFCVFIESNSISGLKHYKAQQKRKKRSQKNTKLHSYKTFYFTTEVLYIRIGSWLNEFCNFQTISLLHIFE